MTLVEDHLSAHTGVKFKDTQRNFTMNAKLNSGEAFPAMTLTAADGTEINLPAASETPLTLVLFYRGHW